MEAIDSPRSVIGHIPEIVDAGYLGFLRYVSPNTKTFRTKKLSEREVAAIHQIDGARIGLAFERLSNSIAWFIERHANEDAKLALGVCETLAVPERVPVFFTVDFDASHDDLAGPIARYFEIVHATCRQAQRLIGVYGSGASCAALKDAGLVHFTWLAMSRGWRGFRAWEPQADIVQHTGTVIGGLDVDTNSVINEDVLW